VKVVVVAMQGHPVGLTPQPFRRASMRYLGV